MSLLSAHTIIDCLVTLKNKKEKFISLMLIFGQLKLLQILMRKLKIIEKELENLEDHFFN